MNIVAIIQARMGSTRLPGKVLRVLGNRTVLSHVIDRVTSVPMINATVVATTTKSTDDSVAKEATRRGTTIYRGSENDVLSRYFEAARAIRADVVIRVTSDCPLIDPLVIGEMVRGYVDLQDSTHPVDYLSNTLERSFPRGLDTEVFAFRALEVANTEARSQYQREHVTPFIYENPDRFHLRSYTNPIDLSRHRWTLDTPEDWMFLTTVFNALSERPTPSTQDVLTLVEAHPELSLINAHVEQKSAAG